jgi:hypothetical protein
MKLEQGPYSGTDLVEPIVPAGRDLEKNGFTIEVAEQHGFRHGHTGGEVQHGYR